MTREEMLEYKMEIDREVARLRKLPREHPDHWNRTRRVASRRDLRYLEALERFREEEAFDFGGASREASKPSAPLASPDALRSVASPPLWRAGRREGGRGDST